MHLHADRNQRGTSLASPERRRANDDLLYASDNRPAAVNLPNWQALANDSPQMSQLKAAQDRANKALSGQTAQLQGGLEEEELLQGKFDTPTAQREETAAEPEREEDVLADSGTVPDGELPEDPILAKGPDDRASPAASKADAAPAGPVRGVPVRASLSGVNAASVRQQSNAGGHADAVSSSASVSWSNPGGKGVGAFGEEAFSPSYSGVKWTQEASDKPINITFNLKAKCAWGVNSGGNVDVSSGTASVVKADTYQDIVNDLTPVLNEKSWRAPRAKYWSKTICEQHEKYHSADDKGWVDSDGKAYIENYLNSRSIDLTDKERKSSSKVTKKVKALLDGALVDLGRANFAFYTGGASSYYSYAGEERAFGDGKQAYLDLAAAVNKQGESLVAKEEEKKKAKEAKAAKKNK